MEITFGEALVVDAARKNGAFLEGEGAVRSGRYSGNKMRSSAAESERIMLFFPGIGEIHELIEIEQFIF